MEWFFKDPPNLPKGVRLAATINTPDILNRLASIMFLYKLFVLVKTEQIHLMSVF